MTTIKRAYLTGDGTYLHRGILKEHAWRWDADRKAWWKDAEWDDAGDVIRTVRGYGGIRNRGAFDAILEDV